MIDAETKDEIDKMDYKEMFRRWRFAPVGDPMFQGEAGAYFSKVMTEKRDKLPEGEHSRISKEIGW